ncbi:MAG TPA: PEP-CTERM sorting domain-containing protein [Thiotrichales bacterium]|nr:PEP-CTERM sorting domain-containing protein [Thiotrichales bacterium]
MLKNILTISIASLGLAAASASQAVPISTTDGIINSTAGTAGYGEEAAWVSGGTGLTGTGNTWPADIGDGAGDVSGEASGVNRYWLQFNSFDPDAAASIRYEFTGAYSQILAVAGLDHGPTPYESLEMIVWGWDGSAWEEGTITAIFDDGADAAWAGDDFSAVWSFNGAYSKFAVTGGTHYTPNVGAGPEGEIDALAAFVAAPEPATVMLLGLGLAGISVASRKRKA